ATRQLRFGGVIRARFLFFDNRRVGRQVFAARQIDSQPDQHADAGGAETPMPSNFFAERPGNERGCDDAGVDEDVINLKRIRAAIVAGRVKRADLAGEISFETTDTGEKTSERDEESHVERHQKMAERHERGSDGDGKSATKPTIRD